MFCFSVFIISHHSSLTIMFISHLLATREVKANQCTQTNEGREVEDEEEVLRHGDTNSKR